MGHCPMDRVKKTKRKGRRSALSRHPVVTQCFKPACSRRAPQFASATSTPSSPCDRVRASPPWASRSEEHTSELQSLMRISYAVFCLKKKKTPLTIFYTSYHMI